MILKDFYMDSRRIPKYGDPMDFKGFLKGSHKDGFHKVVIMILRDSFQDAVSIFYRDSRTCVLDFTTVHTLSIDL